MRTTILVLLGASLVPSVDSEVVRAAVLKLAGAIEKKDAAEAKKQVEVLRKATLLDLMDLFKLRSSEGLGVGLKPNEVENDGIDAKLRELANVKTPYDQQRLDREATHLVPMGYTIAAIAESAHGKCVTKVKEGDKDPARWPQFSAEMRKSAVELAEAARAKDLKAVRAAAVRVQASCNGCHGMFR